MKIKRRIIVLWSYALVFLFVFLPGARSTTLERLSLGQMAAGAAAVARVHCSGTESHWENGSIWTVSTLQVVETIKGKLPGEITVRLPGGRVGHLTATVDGAPQFARGNEAIVFLEPTGAGSFTVTGWAEGTFRISRDARSGAEAVTQDSSHFSLFDTATRGFRTEGIRHMPIEEFRARVSVAIARSQEKTR